LLTTSAAEPSEDSCTRASSKFRDCQQRFTILHVRKQWPPSSSRRQHTRHLVSASTPLLDIQTEWKRLLCARRHTEIVSPWGVGCLPNSQPSKDSVDRTCTTRFALLP
jgi:hypothetical protein